MDNHGWVKLHRKMMGKFYYKDSHTVHLWVHLLLKANHLPQEWKWRGEKYVCQRGELITSRQQLALETGIQESKVERILKCLESEQQIEQQKSNKSRLLKLVNYDLYQKSEQQNEQQMNNKRTTNEQQMNTNNNRRIKELKNEKKKYSDTSDEVRLSLFLLEKIKEANPYVKTPDIQKWAKHIDLMLRLDGIPTDRVEKMILWAKQDAFWSGNILSTESLRKHFSRMYEAAKTQYLQEKATPPPRIYRTDRRKNLPS